MRGVPPWLKSLFSSTPVVAMYRLSSLTLSGSATSGALAPRTAMARRFFAAITAPLPHRPAKWLRSKTTLA